MEQQFTITSAMVGALKLLADADPDAQAPVTVRQLTTIFERVEMLELMVAGIVDAWDEADEVETVVNLAPHISAAKAMLKVVRIKEAANGES